MTKPVELPEIGLYAIKESARKNKRELLNTANVKRAKVSTKKLHLELWQSVTHYDYDKNVRATSEGV